MEQARFFVAIALSLLIFLAWDYFFVKREPAPTPEQSVSSSEGATTVPEEAAKPVALAGDVQQGEPPAATPPESQLPSRKILVKTDLFTAVLDERGAVMRSMKLLNYAENLKDKNTPKEVIDPSLPDGSFLTGLDKNSLPGLGTARFVTSSPEKVDAIESEQRVSFAWQSDSGVIVSKQYRFQPGSYLVEMMVTLTNRSGEEIRDALFITLADTDVTDTKRYGFTGPAAIMDGHLLQIKAKELDDKNQWTGNMGWVALTRNYFMVCLIPEQGADETLRIDHKEKRFDARLSTPEVVVKDGESREFRYHLFAGPKNSDLLSSLGHDLDKAIDFGWFSVIAKPCLWLMNFFYSLIPNYGVAIILLTILTKIVLWPLGNKSYKSMNEMKKIQPLMAELREKYKDDKKQMNEELMKLYRVYKINPMGGCLPMLLQIPVFFALYRMLYEAIELRHANFLWWINDLSAPDRLGNFDISIPFMEAPYGIPVLTIVMGATMFLQQKMSPPPGDPTQAKMMMFLPIVFTFIFINFPAGLVLYWLVNNTMSIAQQYFIQKKQS